MQYNIFYEKSDFIKRNNPSSINDVLSDYAIEKINLLADGKIDHLLIRGIEISKNLPKTPKEIRQNIEIEENKIMTIIGNYLGNISEKGIENSIRFDIDGNNNTETWHNHRQYKYSVFLCLKDDPTPKTYLLSANKIIEDSDPIIKDILLDKLKYISNEESFPLIEKYNNGYAFSKNIFDKSDLEEKIKDLDLPDALQKLDRIVKDNHDEKVQKSVKCLVDIINNHYEYYTFTKGDLMIVEEASTIRFSPEYKPLKREDGDERWILTLSVDH